MAPVGSPQIDKFIKFDRPGIAKISPDGSKVAFTSFTANFKNNLYENRLKVYFVNNKTTKTLTHNGVVSAIEWLNNEDLVVTKSNPVSKGKVGKNQIYFYEGLYGEGRQLTDNDTGVSAIKVHNQGIFFIASDPKRSKKEDRTEKYGTIVHAEEEIPASTLYYLNIDLTLKHQKQVLQSTKSEQKKLVKSIIDLSPYIEFERTIMSIFPIQDGILIQTRIKDDLFYINETQIHFLRIDPDNTLKLQMEEENKKLKEKLERGDNFEKEKNGEDDKLKTFGKFSLIRINVPEGVFIDDISPDKSSILLRCKFRDQLFFTQFDLTTLAIDDLGKSETEILHLMEVNTVSKSLDRTPLFTGWGINGIWTCYFDYSSVKMVQFNSAGTTQEIDTHGFSTFQQDYDDLGNFVALTFNASHVAEFTLFSSNGEVTKITSYEDQYENFNLGTSESIRWKSRDGLEIEGVLHKPYNFDPSKKYPLVLIVHGGPAASSLLSLVSAVDILYYPTHEFLNKEILVLKPNYRGSLGRGQAFVEMYKDNMGEADLWDIESGVDHLIEQGFVDEDKIGCMGWSQGGYISAYAATNSKKFAAISMGAGVSSWRTYYNSNDIRQWALHYLGGSPTSVPEYYDKTAPITNIKNAKTPVLIQHGELDQRVPLSSGTEMFRGLKEMGVETQLFIYKGMPHGITKPVENRTIANQNLSWFSHYLLGEGLNLLGENDDSDKDSDD